MAEESRLEREQLLRKKRLLLAEAARLLLGAVALLDGPQRFSRRAYALDGRGASVRVDDPRAVRFCLVGALLRVEHLVSQRQMAIRTSEADDIEDLLRPVLPKGAPARLRLALEALSWASGRELEALSSQYEETSAKQARELAAPIPTVSHLPLLLGLHPRSGYQRCSAALWEAATVLVTVGLDEKRVDRLVTDKMIQTEESV